MDESQVKQRRVVVSRRACVACRHLKMRCIGAENPPCARCARSGRFCTISQPGEQQRRQLPRQPANFRGTQIDSEYNLPLATQATGLNSNHPEKQSYTGHNVLHGHKPSISRSITTPVSMTTAGPQHTATPTQGRRASVLSPTSNFSAVSASDYTTTTSHAHPSSQSGLGGFSTLNGQYRSRDRNGFPSLPSDEEIHHLCRFFMRNLLPQIPFLTDLDVADLDAIFRSKRPLMYSMAYVAAWYVPGCRALRAKLTPTIITMARLQFDQISHVESTDDNWWTALQALAIVYNWAPQQSAEYGMTDSDTQTEVCQDTLRSSVEFLASRHSLHRSAEEVTELLKQGNENVPQSFAFRKYTFWLWLYSVAHFRSLVLHTPPSIREDATITRAVQLLGNLAVDKCVHRILARVELCLVWVRAGLRERGLGEWWCNIHTQVNLDSTLTLLDDLDVALQRWRDKWCTSEKDASFDDATKSGMEGAIDFYYHFTSFCIGTYVARAFQSSTFAESLPLSRINLLTKTIERGYTFCRFFLELSPLAKSLACFGPEIVFAMVAACCDYLLLLHSSPDGTSLIRSDHLSTIRAVAELMIDLGPDDKHSPKTYGKSILAKLDAIKPTNGQPSSKRHFSHHKRSQTWTAGNEVHQAVQALLQFNPTTDHVLPAQENVGQGGVLNTNYQVMNTTSNDGVSLWNTYNGGESLGGSAPYWTS